MQNLARQLKLKGMHASLLAVMVTLAAVASASAQNQSTQFSNIKIKNFGQMDNRLYRGAQPAERDYKDLAALGVHTIIDLRDDPKSYAKRAAEAAGMRYVNIPMSDSDRPSDETVEKFLALVDDPETGTMYIHCAGGRHRTGLIGAMYRYNKYGWDYDKVYKEMKAFDYYSRWGHGAIKDYVQDYYQHMQTKGIHTTSSEVPSNPK